MVRMAEEAIASPVAAEAAHGETGERERGRAEGADIGRMVTLAAGGALLAYAARRKDWPGFALAIAGGALLARAARTGGRDEFDGLERQHGEAATVDARRAVKIERALTIHNHEARELYDHWRNLENLPRILAHLEKVVEHDAVRSTWTAKAPGGTTVTWDAEIFNEIPGRLIAWKSLPGSRVPNAGSVTFRDAPGGRGTEMLVVLEYEPPAGKLGRVIAKLFGEEPEQQMREDLRRWKQLIETGEIAVSYNPGQGKPARKNWNAKVGAGETGAERVEELQRAAVEQAHDPQHIPQPSDLQRGTNTTDVAKRSASGRNA